MKLEATSTLPSLQDPATLHVQCLLSKVQLWQSRHITPVAGTVCPTLTISIRYINIKAPTAQCPAKELQNLFNLVPTNELVLD